ncbi:MAG: hypothetical protein SFU56_10680 [Capsulimonadales bacterium]|nr:hypothetical protein [Capsulimonadales bacterium]
MKGVRPDRHGGRIGALALLACAGCGMDHAENKGTDTSFIRIPGKPTPSVPMKAGPVLPTREKDRFQWHVTTHRRQVIDDAIKDQVLREEEEEVIVGKTSDGPNPGTVFEIRKNGKPFRAEIFDVSSEQVRQVAAGLGDRVTMVPPLPLMRLPVREGAEQDWIGVLQFRKVRTPGTAYSRVSAQEIVKTPAGEFGAWRVETVIRTTIEGKPFAFPMTRWFAPGVGMVRQRLYVGNILVEKELVRYRPGGK